MSFNTFGKLFRFTTWGESHGPAIGCIVDGCPPNINLSKKIYKKNWIRENQDNQNLQHKEKRTIKFKYYLEFLKVELLVHQYP